MGFRAGEPKGKLYILTGQKPVQVQGAENLVLLAIQTGKGALGAGATSKMEFFRALSGIVVRDLGFLRLPWRPLLLASTKQEAEDQFVDYVIALERLLASDSPQLETTFRFRLRGAALLPGTFGDAQEGMSLMSKLYALRSGIVHGSAKSSDINKLLRVAEDVLRTVFRWYLTHTDANTSPQEIIAKLDNALVEGGSTWARERDAPGQGH